MLHEQARGCYRLKRAVFAGNVGAAEVDVWAKLTEAFRVAYHLWWNGTNRNHMTERIPDAAEHFLMNAQDFGWHEIVASNLLKIDLDGRILSDTDMTRVPAGLNFHSAILRARPELDAILHLHPMHGEIVSAMQGRACFSFLIKWLVQFAVMRHTIVSKKCFAG